MVFRSQLGSVELSLVDSFFIAPLAFSMGFKSLFVIGSPTKSTGLLDGAAGSVI